MNRRLAVLVSGRGSNLQAILDAIARGHLDATVAVVISNRAAAYGLVRARDAGIDAIHLAPADYADRDSHERAIVEECRIVTLASCALPVTCGSSVRCCSRRIQTGS